MRRIAAFALLLLLVGIAAARAAQDPLVWIASSGKGRKYHYENCRTLQGGKTSLPLSKAKARGYTPCKVCNAAGIE